MVNTVDLPLRQGSAKPSPVELGQDRSFVRGRKTSVTGKKDFAFCWGKNFRMNFRETKFL